MHQVLTQRVRQTVLVVTRPRHLHTLASKKLITFIYKARFRWIYKELLSSATMGLT